MSEDINPLAPAEDAEQEEVTPEAEEAAAPDESSSVAGVEEAAVSAEDVPEDEAARLHQQIPVHFNQGS